MRSGAAANRDAQPPISIDERHRLVARILDSPAFQKSQRVRSLLLHITDRVDEGRQADLTEQHIGREVFGKPPDYSPAEDSIVRVQARQLRLKLHEFYETDGRDEPIVLEIPRGSYLPVFRWRHEAPLSQPAAVDLLAEPAEPVRRSSNSRWFWSAALLAAFLAGFFLHRFAAPSPAPAAVPWPLSEIAGPAEQTQVIISDVSYGLFTILGGRPPSLEEYVSPQYPALAVPGDASLRERLLADHLGRTSFVSYADAVMTNRLLAAFGSRPERVRVRSARDVKTRDLADGNLLFIGSPASNPWVSLFEDQLNFVEHKFERTVTFRNKAPRPGEASVYAGLSRTGASGEDYAAIALLPLRNGKGNVIILQGLQQEGTEAAGRILTTEEGRLLLRRTLGLPSAGPVRSAYFEVLIRSRAVGGSTADTEIASTRRLDRQPSR